MKVGIVGANGFIGQALCRAVATHPAVLEPVMISRQTYAQHKAQEYDVLINTAMPSKRFWAFQNPLLDFDATVRLTAELIYEWKYGKFVQISSLSARTQLDVPYGINKRTAESLVETHEHSLIIRLAALYGKGFNKGALHDLIHRKKVYVDIHSAYNYLDVDFAAAWIIDNINQTGIKEIAARDTITLAEIAQEAWPEVEYEGKKEIVYSDRVEAGMPSSQEVWKYVRQELLKTAPDKR
ncbi:MAG: hypothetical protein KKE37_07050 [Verrucomicrobia bacterium]|nr:hypothetical protein [Verrucomicrobiota bacterium]MBU4291525.1 hypothetical protein [Verrucomicrobiota bacterium]MBU4429094.1 hypothetical protein [Verrucomicrobiota bacterium]MCG2678642.1 hypothetical protein [Kiritimatiellia bacterium]